MSLPQSVTSSFLVRDIEESESFYRSVLWSHAIGSETGMTTVQLPDGSRLRLGEAGHPRAGASIATASIEIRGLHTVIPHLSLDEWTRHLFMHGVVLEGIEADDIGNTHLTFHDPDGNLLVVVVPPNAN